MARDFQDEARKESVHSEAIKQWVQMRIKTLHERVTAHDVLRRYDVKLQYNSDRSEQIACPFHGEDKNPSARVYPETNEGPSHVWCYVCRESWDCIKLWKKFTAFEGRFTALLRDLERNFGITPPETPEGTFFERDENAEEIKNLFEVCERRLAGARRAFDMKGYLTIGSILDRAWFNYNKRILVPDEAKILLRRVLDKVGEKERSCPDG